MINVNHDKNGEESEVKKIVYNSEDSDGVAIINDEQVIAQQQIIQPTIIKTIPEINKQMIKKIQFNYFECNNN